MSMLDSHMARSTENQRLAAACRHQFDPGWLFAAWVVVQVIQGSDMVDFNLLGVGGCPALFTG